MEKKWNIHTVIPRLAAVLLMLVLVTTSVVTGRYARYTTASTGSDSARVAVMAMDTTYIIEEELPMAPGETVEFTVTLTNKEDGRICEVAQNYSMTVENLTDNMALSFKYYLVDGETETLQDSASGIFHAGVEQSATYKIKITWTGAPQPASSAFEVDGLKIVIMTEQID